MQCALRQIFQRETRGQNAILRVVFADGRTFTTGEGPPAVTIVFRRRAAEWWSVLLGYVGLFEAYFDGSVGFVGDRPVARLKHIAFSSTYPYRANPVLSVMRQVSGLAGRQPRRRQAQANARHITGCRLIFFGWCLAMTASMREATGTEHATTIAAAQRARCDYVCRKPDVETGDQTR